MVAVGLMRNVAQPVKHQHRQHSTSGAQVGQKDNLDKVAFFLQEIAYVFLCVVVTEAVLYCCNKQ